MESKQNPFSFYDFLGYFTPGAIFLYAVLLVFPFIQISQTELPLISDIKQIDKLGFYIPFILSAYVLGHLLSFLSAVTIEKYSIWTSGYPSKYLLGIKINGLFTFDEPRLIRGIGRFVVISLLLPVVIFDVIIGYGLKLRNVYSKPLDPLLLDLIKPKIELLLNNNGNLNSKIKLDNLMSENYFIILYHYCVEHAANHLPKMQNYVALFGFLRTLTFITVLGFWTALIVILEMDATCPIKLILFLCASSVCYIFYMAFTKFYRRFTFEALMAFTAVYPPTNCSDKK